MFAKDYYCGYRSFCTFSWRFISDLAKTLCFSSMELLGLSKRGEFPGEEKSSMLVCERCLFSLAAKRTEVYFLLRFCEGRLQEREREMSVSRAFKFVLMTYFLGWIVHAN